MDKSYAPVAEKASINPTYLRAKDIAKKLGLCSKTIGRWSDKGHFKKYKVSDRLCLYDERDVLNYISDACICPGEVES